MKKILLAFIIVSFGAFVGNGQDICTSATPINCGAVVAGNTSGFTADVAPFCGTGDGTGGGLWYVFTATCTSTTASLCGSSFDTKIRVYNGSCAAPNCVVGIDDACGLQSTVTWASTPGTTYYILVHGYGGAQGAYTLTMTCSGACCVGNPPAADFSAPTVICAGTTAAFTDLSSCSPTSWSWSFPGGTPASSTAQNPVITYNTPGTYNVTLTATNAVGSDVEVKNLYITVVNTVADFTVPTTVCEGSTASFTDLSTCSPTSWSWSFPGGTPATSTAQNPVITYATAGVYDVTLTATNAFGSDVEVKSSYINVINCAGSCVGNYYYVRSNTTVPWGSNTNETAMSAVFGAGIWTQAFFETANPATMFSAATCTIFMEGSDGGAFELETFLNANMTLIENWVSAGGRLFLNAAPNEDNGMSFGFGGVNLVYSGGPLQSNATAMVPAHQIFNATFLPVGLAWTGNYFSHATLSGPYGTTLIQYGGSIQASEKNWGSGIVIFGTMTTPNWQAPAPNAQNLRQNILCYLAPPIVCASPLPIELISFTGKAGDDANILTWITASETDNDYFTVERSAQGAIFEKIAVVDGAGNSAETLTYDLRDEKPADGINYYRLKQTDINGEFKYSATIAIERNSYVDVKIYPNPAEGSITIYFNEKPKTTVNVSIRNTIGQALATEMFEQMKTIDISSLPVGMYLLEISVDGKVSTHKFTKK